MLRRGGRGLSGMAVDVKLFVYESRSIESGERGREKVARAFDVDRDVVRGGIIILDLVMLDGVYNVMIIFDDLLDLMNLQ